jgi:hypothetical protein
VLTRDAEPIQLTRVQGTDEAALRCVPSKIPFNDLLTYLDAVSSPTENLTLQFELQKQAMQ